MKLNYFMRGLGIGILITTITLSIAFHFSDNYKLSQEEIIQEAKNLGLVEASEVDLTDSNKNNIVNIDDLLEKEKSEPDKTEEETAEVETTEEETTEVEATEEETAEAETAEEETVEAETAEEETVAETEEVSITIRSGMTSETVSRLLYDNGLIEDTKDFNNYLINNGYSSKIRVGTFKIPQNTSYEEIVKIIA